MHSIIRANFIIVLIALWNATAAPALPRGCPPYSEIGLDFYANSLDDWIKRYPEQPNYLQFLTTAAVTYAAYHHADCGMMFAEEAVRIAPDSAGPYITRATVHNIRKDYRKALADVDRALVIIAQGGGPFDKTQAAGRLDSLTMSARFLRANILQHMRDFSGALVELNAFLASAKDDYLRQAILTQRARLYFEMKRYDDALADCDAAKPKLTAMDGCNELRGDIYFARREFDKATLSYDENVKTLEATRVQFDANQGKFGPLVRKQWDASFARALAKACRAKTEGGWLKAAAIDCKRAVEFGPDEAFVQFAIGKCVLAQGDRALAKQYFAKAVELDPSLQEAQEALRALR